MSHFPRAPLSDGEVLLHPAEGIDALVRSNETALSSGTLFDRPIAEVRAESRQELAGIALPWTGTRPQRHSAHWIVGGHQPELFHPGVWVKNVVVARVADRMASGDAYGVGLNLVVDTDLSTTSSITLPGRNEGAPATIIPWDDTRPAGPWEERPSPNEALFTSFGDRCRAAMEPWGWTPLACQFAWGSRPEWPLVDRLVKLRHDWEVDHGIDNLELKSSMWSESRSFRWFAWQLMADAAAFRSAYNQALQEYRSTNRIRSQSHPVPQLETNGSAIEVPLWVWRNGEQQRGLLFVEAVADRLRLSDGQRLVGELPCPALSSPLDADAAFAELKSRGWKLRPRALLTTLAMRLCVASVFVHGIGGAKYDELTNRIIATYFRREPPQLIIATATLRLFERFSRQAFDRTLSELRGNLRQYQWNPERLVPVGSSLGDLIQEKYALTVTRPSDLPRTKAAGHHRIQTINAALQAALRDQPQTWVKELAEGLAQRPRETALRSREYPAVLFPEGSLEALFAKTDDH